MNAASILGTLVYRSPADAADYLSVSVFNLKEIEDALLLLSHPSLPVQYSMILLRYCMVPKLTYLIRTLAPSCIYDTCKKFDAMIMECVFRLLSLNDVPASTMTPDILRKQLQLRCRMGGWGLTSQARVCHFAYLDSLSQAIFQDTHTSDIFSRPSKLLVDKVDSILHGLTDEFKTLPRTAAAFIAESRLPRKQDDTHSLQKTLSHDAHKHSYSELCDYFSCRKDLFQQARLIAIQAPAASRWKTTLPNESDCRLDCDSYVVAARMNLGVAPYGNMPDHCGYCMKRIGSVGADSLHALSCVYLKGRQVTQRHDAVQDAVAEYAVRAGVPVFKHQCTLRYVVKNTKANDASIDSVAVSES